VDLQEPEHGERLKALLASLLASQPSERVLDRLTPINRGRLLVEIDDEATLACFTAWLRAAATSESTGPALRRLLEPLGRLVRVLGGQWIVPKATEYEPRIAPQTPHTDVDTKGEVIAIAINVRGHEMGTLIDAKAHIGESGHVRDGSGFGRASTPIFAYDTGAVHGGPGAAHVDGPYPRYFVERAFVLLCSAELDPARVAKHRADNGLRGAADVVIAL